jgi:hypothetical protein
LIPNQFVPHTCNRKCFRSPSLYVLLLARFSLLFSSVRSFAGLKGQMTCRTLRQCNFVLIRIVSNGPPKSSHKNSRRIKSIEAVARHSRKTVAADLVECTLLHCQSRLFVLFQSVSSGFDSLDVRIKRSRSTRFNCHLHFRFCFVCIYFTSSTQSHCVFSTRLHSKSDFKMNQIVSLFRSFVWNRFVSY